MLSYWQENIEKKNVKCKIDDKWKIKRSGIRLQQETDTKDEGAISLLPNLLWHTKIPMFHSPISSILGIYR